MTVGRWGTEGPIVVASHGITGSLMLWTTLVDELGPGFRVIAPDHRGRGGSASLLEPFGLAQHADDLVAMMDALSLDDAILIGNSMGGAVVTRVAANHPDRAQAVILADGGIPVNDADETLGRDPGEVRSDLARRLGPTIDRLSMTFESLEAYRAHWQGHPAFRAAGQWSPYLDAYIEYDLTGEPPALHSRVRSEPVLQDAIDLRDNAAMADALSRVACRVVLLRAPFGALGTNSPNIPLAAAEEAQRIHPLLAVETVEDANHLTITIGPRGASAIARWTKSFAASDSAVKAKRQ